MAEDRLRLWERLFRHALYLIDSVQDAGERLTDWTFGGGTVLMRRYRHRLSKDIDIFIPSPQYLNYLSPHLNEKAEALTTNYDLQAGFLKLVFDDGEIDFVVSGSLTQDPVVRETIFNRQVAVETPVEIIAKKVWYRGADFTARDVFDLALVAEREPVALREIYPILAGRKAALSARLTEGDATLRRAFSDLEILEYRRSYDECLNIVRKVLASV